MKLADFQTGMTDWAGVPVTEHPGAQGVARVRAVTLGEVQLRRIVYSAGYLADHWCSKGHIVVVLEGELTMEHRDGAAVRLGSESVYYTADEAGAHRARSQEGATVLVLD